MKRILSKFKKFNRTVLHKKTPLLSFTVLELSILCMVMIGGALAIIARSQSPSITGDTTSSQAENKGIYSTSDTDSHQPTSTKQQNNPQPQNSGTTTKSNLPDQYGCIPQTSGYDACVKAAKANKLYFWCSDMEKAAYDKYSAVGDKAWATRDAVLAEWKTVYTRMVQQNYPLNAINSEEARYKKMAYTDTNAIIKPAYTEYVSTLNSLKSQGCEVTVLSDLYSWPGY